ncbi:MAG: hypothetical protein CL710_06125 [Chloroflexi bacterium]|nr:hypothetical protein [Chloroflexota bacterium]|tara:strand:- start:698 stop:1096 length:399 start_codon:yes stop_codon:yes gene_type:complete
MQKEYFNITRIYSEKNGETHFEDIMIELHESSSQALESLKFKAHEIIFRKAPATQARAWHLAPEKQLVVSLSGKATITVSDGEKRTFGPGSILLVEDTEEFSKGHTTVADEKAGERKTLFIPIEPSQLFIKN